MEAKRPSRTAKLQRVFELAATQAGYFTAAQARALGYGARSLQHHVGADIGADPSVVIEATGDVADCRPSYALQRRSVRRL